MVSLQSVAKRYEVESVKLQNRFEPLFNKDDSKINITAGKIPPIYFSAENFQEIVLKLKNNYPFRISN